MFVAIEREIYHTIAAPIILGSNLSVTASTGSTLTIAGGISESNSGKSLSFGGGGELILSGTDSYTRGTTVNNGTMATTSAHALPSAGVLVAGRTGRVVLGNSLGIGSLLVASLPVSADVVALSANASMPTTVDGYDNTSENTTRPGCAPALPTGDMGSAGTAAAVPEPGTMALLAAVVLMLIVASWKRCCRSGW